MKPCTSRSIPEYYATVVILTLKKFVSPIIFQEKLLVLGENSIVKFFCCNRPLKGKMFFWAENLDKVIIALRRKEKRTSYTNRSFYTELYTTLCYRIQLNSTKSIKVHNGTRFITK